MRTSHKFFIDGKWVDPVAQKSLFEVINPATEERSGQISLGSAADVDLAVAAAKKAFITFSRTTREERISMFERIITEYRARRSELARVMTEEMGAPLSFADKMHAAIGQIHLKTALNVLRTYPFDEFRGSTRIVHEPIGVCALITPWNWPINQIAAKAAPALACGCTIVLKPSEMSPFSATIWTEILEAAGVPPGVFNMVHGSGPEVGAALSSHVDVDMVSFTGSTRAGIDVARNAAITIKRVHQELGGKSANILLPDADFEKAVTAGLRGVITNSGQSCNAPTRMLVPADKIDEVSAIASRAAAALKIGDPTGDVDLGPVVSQLQFDKIQALIQQGIDEGATLVAGGLGRPESLAKGYYVKPTVFANVTNEMTIAREEIFGPVLSIIAYRNLDEAVAIANDSPYGLAGYVQGKDSALADDIASRLRVGQVVINGALPDPMAPFGGYKHSGNGREYGEFGFEAFVEVKAVLGSAAAPAKPVA